MRYCSRCLQPDTRPNGQFDPAGVCSACGYFASLADTDWRERHDILAELADAHRGRNAGRFDCIIGVSGGKDSVRQALFVRDKLKLRPLLVCLSYPPQQLTERGAANLSNLIGLGFDVIVSGPAPQTWRRLMRASFDRFTNWARSTELALFSCVPRAAIHYEIPLIFWGENPGLQLGDLKTLGRTGYDGNNLRHMNTLDGGASTWMLEDGVAPEALLPYRYPSAAEFDAAQLQIVYLGWFLGDWSLVTNAGYACGHGLEKRTDTVGNTGDLYGVTSLDEDWVTLNQMIKYYKFGFGRVTDYANEEIRLGRLPRARAVELVRRYDGACADGYISSFCEFIGIDEPRFWEQVRSSVNRELFEVGLDGGIRPRFEVGVGL